MKLFLVLPWLLCALLAACGGNGLAAMKPEIDVEIVNHFNGFNNQLITN